MVKNIKINIKNKQAFSLIEILMSILIVSLIFVAMAPVFTKRILPHKNNGVVFTYQKNDILEVPHSCFITTIDFEDGNYDETYYESTDCSQYKFTVPDGVNRINLTLVAGGGGGGGAAGGFEETISLATGNEEETYQSAINPDIVKNAQILYMAARGQDGKEAYLTGNQSNESCAEISDSINSGYCGGKGGNSSIALYNFDIPKEYLKGAGFVNNLSTQTPVAGNYSVSNEDDNAVFSISWGDNSEDRTVSYGIEKNASAYDLYCSIRNSRTNNSNMLFDSVCKVPSIAYIPSVEGGFGSYAQEGSSTKVKVNSVFKGGLAGQNSLAFSSFGTGGQGQGFQISKCSTTSNYGQSCNIEDASFVKLNPDKEDGTIDETRKGKIGNASVKITTERAGGAGGGGAAGAAIRIVNLPVVPNETYTIVVGKGGAGGSKGSTSTSPSGGANGVGGTTSAIYDSNGNLIYMVNGGAGGEGGKIWNASSGLYAGRSGLSGRNFKMLITGDVNRFLTTSTDENIATGIAALPSNPSFLNQNGGNVANMNARRIQLNALQDEPYLELNRRTRTDTNQIQDFTGNVANKTGGFSGFDVTSVNVSQNQYDGLYYRSLIDGHGAYIGGLGGFSGLGNKAGCGGYFMGNFDGRQNREGTLPSNEATRQNILNSFVLNNVSYKVSDYYENCSTASPNGTKAEFIAPSPNSSNYGSAGSGGGGGGYNINSGSGNGGDGQDGYVMIEWRK